MNTWKDFLSFTNIKNKIPNLTIMLVLLSVLYCSIYTMVVSIVQRSGSMLVSYVFLYLIVMVAAYVFLIVLFQFIKIKRQDSLPLSMKHYRLPLLGVQSLLYFFMAGSSWLSFQMILWDMLDAQMILRPIMLLMMIFYVPVQVFAFFAIYDGARNPFIIIKDAFVKIIKHYRSVFYSMLILFLAAFLYTSLMDALFQYGTLFSVISGVVDIMTRSNPFMDAMELGLSLSGNLQLLPAFVLALVYGALMSVLLVLYYTFMACVYDEDVRI